MSEWVIGVFFILSYRLKPNLEVRAVPLKEINYAHTAFRYLHLRGGMRAVEVVGCCSLQSPGAIVLCLFYFYSSRHLQRLSTAIPLSIGLNTPFFLPRLSILNLPNLLLSRNFLNRLRRSLPKSNMISQYLCISNLLHQNSIPHPQSQETVQKL